MAKKILSLFGGLLIVAGIAVAGLGLLLLDKGIQNILVIWPILLAGGGLLVCGAFSLGFSQAIDLLEAIERNSRRTETPETGR